jgi:uncharacterized protein YoxC
MSVLDIFYIILLLSASFLCIALIIYLNRITQSVKEIETDLRDISLQVKPLIASATNLSEKLNQISQDAKGQLNIAKDIISEIKNRIDRILEFEEKFRKGFEVPLNDVIKNLSAIVNGVKTFWNTYRKH